MDIETSTTASFSRTSPRVLYACMYELIIGHGLWGLKVAKCPAWVLNEPAGAHVQFGGMQCGQGVRGEAKHWLIMLLEGYTYLQGVWEVAL